MHAIVNRKEIYNSIWSSKLKIFEDCVIPYLNDPYKDEYRFDLSIAQHWIFQKVLDLGWTVERFGRFDRNLSRYFNYGRSAHKLERIGKKYQWIAYHEFLARISDNFEFREELSSDRPSKYEGPWQMFVRDIDPSFLSRKTEREAWQPHTNTWWFPSSYNAWASEPDDLTWLKSSEDLPTIKPFIEVINPDDGSKWLVLEAFYRWEQPTPPEEERFEIPRRDIRYMLKSYIVKKSDIDELYEWAKKQNFFNDRMPESRTLHRVFLGEFFCSPAYEYHCSPYYGYEEWTRGHDLLIPREVLVTAEQYFWEYGNYDCSIDETVCIYLPSKWLTEFLSLRWNGVEGQFFDNEDNLIAFDPSVRTVGSGALLLHRDADKYATQSLANFLYPCQALTSILDKTSIARLDLAVFADQRDVKAEEINVKFKGDYDEELELLREALKWCWSNTAKIQFTDEAVRLLLKEATNLYNAFFCESVPLVSIDMKWKLARLSTAVAFLTLSTEEDFSTVTVTEDHVKEVVEFLKSEYVKAGLNTLAQEERFEILSLEDVDHIIDRIIEASKGNLDRDMVKNVFKFIVLQGRVTRDRLKTKFGLTETNQLRPLLSVLSNEKMVRAGNGLYPTPHLVQAYKVLNVIKVNKINNLPVEPPKKSEADSEKVGGSAPDLDNHDNLDKKTIKSVKSLGKDTYEGTCAGKCGEKRILYWHVTNFQGKWGDFCQDCGMKVQETMQKKPYYNVQKEIEK